jgi:hypothetical protein
VLPPLPLASELAAGVDETFDATASVNNGVLSVWVLTKAGRVFRWTEGGVGWDESWPLPQNGDPGTFRRGTGIAPREAGGVSVIRDLFERATNNQAGREFVTLEGTGSVVTNPANSASYAYSPRDILPHGRSVSYDNFYLSPTVDCGQACGGLGCGWWGRVTSLNNDVWSSKELPIDAGLVLGSTLIGRYAVSVGGQVYTQQAYGPTADWARRAGRSASERVAALDALSDDDVWAVESDQGLHQVRHYDGRTWSEGFRAPPGGAMVALKDSVWITSDRGGDAKGDYDPKVVSRWRAGEWTNFSFGDLVSLAKDGPDSLWAVDNSTTSAGARVARLHRWDGTAWSDLGSPFAPNESIRGLSAAGGVVWAAGDAIYRREGGRTDTIVCAGQPTGAAYSAVFAVGDEAWVVAVAATNPRENTLFHVSGTRCMVVGTPRGEQLSILKVVGVRASDAWVVATTGWGAGSTGPRDRGEPRLFHWDGRTLEPSKLAVDPRFVSASVSPLGTLWVGGTHGAILRSAVPKPN